MQLLFLKPIISERGKRMTLFIMQRLTLFSGTIDEGYVDVSTAVLTGSVTGVAVEADGVVVVDPPPLFFCTVAWTTCPAVLKMISTRDPSCSKENVFWISPLPSCFSSPTCVMSRPS